MEKVYQEAIDQDDNPGVIIVAQDTAGKFNYAKAWGSRRLLDGSKKQQEADDILNTYSSTKLLTTIAALQCVEKGLFTLDEEVTRILPELESVQVLKSIDNDVPQYEDRQKPITLRLLLTHSSGYAYDIGPPLSQWRSLRGEGPMHGATVEERAGLPLTAQPGTSWSYGVGLDWAGKMVERTTGKTLEEYFHAHIFQPLGIVLASFWPKKHEAIRAKMIDLNPDDPRGVGIAGTMGRDLNGDPTDCVGGGGCFMSPKDFVKILYSLLANDEKLLTKKTVDSMFEPHLTEGSHRALNKSLMNEQYNIYFGQGLPVGTKRDFGLGGMITQQSQPGWYQEGTMFWAGGANIAWFVDRKSGLCGMAAPQFYVRDTPSKRSPEEQKSPKPRREGGKVYEEQTRHLKQVFREGIYDVYREWEKGEASVDSK